MTLDFAQALQYWAKEVSLPASADYCPLAMSVVELKQHMGRYITLSKQDILKDLGSAIHETEGWDTERLQVDPIISSGVKGMWSCPTETLSPRHQSKAKNEDEEASLADPTASPAKSDAKYTQSSPWKLHWWVTSQ